MKFKPELFRKACAVRQNLGTIINKAVEHVSRCLDSQEVQPRPQMKFTIHRLKVRFLHHKQDTLLHFLRFQAAGHVFNHIADDGHKTREEAEAFGRMVCSEVNDLAAPTAPRPTTTQTPRAGVPRRK